MIQHVSRAFALLSLSLSLLSSYNQPFGILILAQYLQENRDYVSVNRDTTFVVIIIQIHQARRPTPFVERLLSGDNWFRRYRPPKTQIYPI
jgi:hypothetical protein